MSKRIEINVADNDYVLEYDRASVQQIEGMGFRATDDYLSQPATATSMLFYGALLKNQPHMTQSLSQKILDSFMKEYNCEGLMRVLVNMMKESLPNGDADSEQKKTFTVIG